MARAGTPQEIEWQFDALDVGSVGRWLEAAVVPGYTETAGQRKRMDDEYFDTGDWRLHRAGYTCRIRKTASKRELTIKTMAEAQNGLRTRIELNEYLDDEETPPARAPGACGELVRLVAGRHPLTPLFRLEQERRTFTLADAESKIAEIALDSTTIPVAAEDVPLRLSRVEIELTDGTEERANRFVQLLVAANSLSPVTMTKFEAGMLAAGSRPPTPLELLGPTDVIADMSAGAVAFAVMRKHFWVFLSNEGGTRLGDDAEALHDMRVAARRLRAAMSAFRPFVSSRMERYRNELGRVAAALGAVRDLDVQLEQLAEWRTSLPADRHDSLAGLEALLQTRRSRARRAMLFTLNSRRNDLFAAAFSAALWRGPARSFVPGRARITDVAPGMIEKRYRRVMKMGKAVKGDSPPEAYHALRIEGKKLRYLLEFMAPIYGKPATDLSARVTSLQDVLGEHQDADVAVAHLHEMAASASRRLGAPTLLAMGSIAERYRVRAEELRSEFPKVFKGLEGNEWRRLREQMGRLSQPPRDRPVAPRARQSTRGAVLSTPALR